MWRRPKFWQKKFSVISFLLLPFSFLYGGAVFLRLKRTPHHVGIKVISIGNFIAGGAGKTPTALYVARALKRAREESLYFNAWLWGKHKRDVSRRASKA